MAKAADDAEKSKKKSKKAKAGKRARSRNLLIIGKDGNVVVATGQGRVKVVADKALATKLSEVLTERQRAGRDVTEILREAGFDVVAGSTTGVWPDID